MAEATEPWTHREEIVNGIRLHWVEQGLGPLVVLLHGFPEFWYSWRHQIPVLARRCRVVAPDMRGYNLSEQPARGYDLETLTDDVRALIETLGEKRAVIVGHDWGGMVAWVFAMRFPELTEKLVVMNAPHPGRFREEMRRPRQFLRSTYALFFQLPRLPELLLGANGCWPIGQMLRNSARVKDAFSDDDLERFREAMARPGALTAALNYYRAVRPDRLPDDLTVQAPTLLLWGVHDQALGVPLTRGLGRWVPNLTVQYLECGHWTQQERFEEVNRYLLEFL
jgi:pimeloyl-ACP methyl ester carboxylesterase